MDNDVREHKADIEQLLKQGKTIQFNPIGWSMVPLFIPPDDQAVVTPDFDKIKRLDVMVYRRPGGPLVIHRVYKVTKEGIYMVGDRQVEIEGPLPYECMLGKMVSFVRKGHTYSTKNVFYKAYSVIWMWLRPMRNLFAKAAKGVLKFTKTFSKTFK